MIQIEFDNKQLELAQECSVADLIKEQPNRHTVLGALINGESKDLSAVVQNNDKVTLLKFENPEGQYMFWHTSAHVLAQAILRLYPEAQPTIGPPIEEGFYYDFSNLDFAEGDFEKLEQEIAKILKENYSTNRIEYKNKEEALAVFEKNSFKKELIEEFAENLSAYRQGEFVDLCKGPHIPNLSLIKAFKILKTSGSYWRGDAKNPQLTRIYAISYPDKKLLKNYLFRLQEAQKRDHRILGKRLQLFSFHKEAPGMPLFQPKGIVLWDRIMDFWKSCHKDTYLEIKTPIMLNRDLWVTSGHWENYRENMYLTNIDEMEYAIKPMNCPGCLLYYNNQQYSYRQLPLRIAELGLVHRHELKGALGGLFRVRAFHQDDAHIFMKQEDIKEEILGVLKLSEKIYSCFGLDFHLELSTRPKKSIGTDEQWEVTTQGLRLALEKGAYKFVVNEGDGAFYGPKIDMHIKDALGRTWQCGTIQLDMTLPERFDLGYINQAGDKTRPIMIHRTIMGSIERFTGVLIEHFSGRFPFWMSPSQVKILTVADRHLDFAKKTQEKLLPENWVVEIDDNTESIGKKVRQAQIEQWNYILVIGDKEIESDSFNIRTRKNKQITDLSLQDFIQKLKEEESTRSLTDLF